jgi:hypothetical protein
MDDPAAVRDREAGQQLQRDLGASFRRQRPTIDHGAHRLAVEEFGDEVRLAARADVENGQNILMRERGDRPRFLLEALPREASAANDAGSTLTATSRPKRGSRAL